MFWFIKSMTSEFRIVRSLEWCTSLPITDCPRESPLFVLSDMECFLRFNLVKQYINWRYELVFVFKGDYTNWKPCLVKLQVGFKKEKDLSLAVVTYSVFNKTWSVDMKALQSRLPSDYMDGNCIKFLFCFHSLSGDFLKISKKVVERHPERWDSERNTHLKALSRDLLQLLDESSEYDVEIECEGKTFKAHRNVLGTRSAVFSAMLRSNMVEGETGLITIEDFGASIFQNFLCYLYSGILPKFNVENAQQFYEIGDKYAVEELKKSCSEFLIKNLSGDNACKVLLLADMHSDLDFRKSVISYIVNKDIPIVQSCWPEFCKNHPALANEAMLLYIQNLHTKNETLKQTYVGIGALSISV